MTSLNRIDQAVLLLKERLRKLSEGKTMRDAAATGAAGRVDGNSLTPIRQLLRQKDIGEHELKRAFIRALLADALGEDLATSLEFQTIADQVTRMIEESENGRGLLEQAIAEMG